MNITHFYYLRDSFGGYGRENLSDLTATDIMSQVTEFNWSLSTESDPINIVFETATGDSLTISQIAENCYWADLFITHYPYRQNKPFQEWTWYNDHASLKMLQSIVDDFITLTADSLILKYHDTEKTLL